MTTINAIAASIGVSDDAVTYAAFVAAGGNLSYDIDYLGDGNIRYNYRYPNAAAHDAVVSVGVDNISDFTFDPDMY